jgi:hypothetical protein
MQASIILSEQNITAYNDCIIRLLLSFKEWHPVIFLKKHKNTDDEGNIFLKNVGKFLPKYAEQYNIESNIFVCHISTTNFIVNARD